MLSFLKKILNREKEYADIVTIFTYNGKKIAEYKNCFIKRTANNIILITNNRRINLKNEIAIKHNINYKEG